MVNPTKSNPWKDFLFLLLLVFVCSIVTQVPAVIVGLFISGDIESVLKSGDLMSGNPAMTYLLLASSSIGTFLLPAYFFQRMRRETTIFPMEHRTNWLFYVLAIAFMLSFSPLMTAIGAWNEGMKLPQSLQTIESWMRTQEDSMAALTESVVMVNSWPMLFTNILVMAIIPGIAEELFFRGALQRIFEDLLKNKYAAIWVVAVIFSAIHVQFYGFFPRLLLGVFFGYMLVWTQNIWVPVLAHIVNNAIVTVVAFQYTREGKSYSDLMEAENYPFIAYIGSLILSVGIAYLYYRYTEKKTKLWKRIGLRSKVI